MSMTCIDHCEVESGNNGPVNFRSSKNIASGELVCTECYRTIQPQEPYLLEVGEWHGTERSYVTCEDCRSVRASFFGAGFYYGNIWDDLRRHITAKAGEIGEIHISCLSPAARTIVCNIIQGYWNDEDRQNADQWAEYNRER